MKIKSITIISAKGKTQTMSLEEAKELYDSLGEIFESETIYTPQPFTQPYVFERYRPYVDPWPTIVYGDRTITTTTDSNIFSEAIECQ